MTEETGTTGPVTDGERDSALREAASATAALGWTGRRAVVAHTLLNDGLIHGKVSFGNGGIPMAASVLGITAAGRAHLGRRKDARRRFRRDLALMAIGAVFAAISSCAGELGKECVKRHFADKKADCGAERYGDCENHGPANELSGDENRLVAPVPAMDGAAVGAVEKIVDQAECVGELHVEARTVKAEGTER